MRQTTKPAEKPTGPAATPPGQHMAEVPGGRCRECGASPAEMAVGACSELARALWKRGRPIHVFPLENVFGFGGIAILKAAVRVLAVAEEVEAVDAAHKQRAEESKRAGAGEDAAKADKFSFEREKNVQALFRAFRSVGADGKPEPNFAAFPGVGWMRENLSGDQIDALLALYDELKRKHAGVTLELDDETIEAIAKVLYDHRGDDIPEAYLAERPRWFLTHLCVLFASMIFEARKARDVLLEEAELSTTKEQALEAENAELRAQLAALRGEAPPAEPAPETPPA